MIYLYLLQMPCRLRRKSCPPISRELLWHQAAILCCSSQAKKQSCPQFRSWSTSLIYTSSKCLHRYAILCTNCMCIEENAMIYVHKASKAPMAICCTSQYQCNSVVIWSNSVHLDTINFIIADNFAKVLKKLLFRTTCTFLEIHVKDVNIHPPVFDTSLPKNVSISENAEIGDILLELKVYILPNILKGLFTVL